MSIPMVRKRLPDGSLGPLEPAFPEVVQIDETILYLLEAIAGQQEQIMQLQEQVEALKGVQNDGVSIYDSSLRVASKSR